MSSDQTDQQVLRFRISNNLKFNLKNFKLGWRQYKIFR